jgi:hypothetical protein
MSKFVALIYEDEQKWIDWAPGAQEAMEQHNKFGADRADVLAGGQALQPTTTATSLRRGADGAVQITDGPFVETKEALGGFYVIEASDLDEALEIAKEIPAPFGGVEVRPVMVFE